MIGLIGSDVSALAKPYARSLALWLWGPWIDGSYWTLPIELCFYGLVAVLLAARSFARIHWLALLLGSASGFFVLCGYLGIDLNSQYRVANFVLRNQQFFLLKYGCFFSLGLWIWISLKQRGPFTVFGFAVALSGCVVEIVADFGTAIVATPVIATYFSGTTWTPLSIWAVAITGMIFASRASTATALPPVTAQVFRAIGLMTYPLYLLHDNIGTGTMRLLITAGTQPVVALVAATLLMIAASFFVSSYLEPIVRLGLTKPHWLRLRSAMRAKYSA
jgi:peptidoglycan/LPS O-acetylase OafA/YrhL